MLTWQWTRFPGLSGGDIYDLLALRSQIFVVEQKCIFLDADGVDRQCWHLLGRDAAGELQAYLRIVDPGGKYELPSMGRVVVDVSRRGRGLGHLLVAEGLRRCDAAWPRQANRISAQFQLQDFYAQHGYRVVGDIYLEDDMPHIAMERLPG